MKTAGLIGGLSWESTALYYRLLNQGVKKHLGGLHSARILLNSLDFAEIEQMQAAGLWHEAAIELGQAALRLERIGADCILICSNTMHKVADEVESLLNVPLLHIADATGAPMQKNGITTAGLIGTRFTMEEDFYRGRLTRLLNLDCIVPQPDDRQIIDRVIFSELCRGIIKDDSRAQYRRIVNTLADRGAEAVILGCTEIGLLITAADCQVPLYDTTELHVEQALHFMLRDKLSTH
jgi:aspartate racemase